MGSNENCLPKKYQDYCRSRELKDEIFQMVARPGETLEEYVELQYNLKRSPYGTLIGEVLKETLLKGMKDEWVVLSLQETTYGCKLSMPGNLRNQ